MTRQTPALRFSLATSFREKGAGEVFFSANRSPVANEKPGLTGSGKHRPRDHHPRAGHCRCQRGKRALHAARADAGDYHPGEPRHQEREKSDREDDASESFHATSPVSPGAGATSATSANRSCANFDYSSPFSARVAITSAVAPSVATMIALKRGCAW